MTDRTRKNDTKHADVIRQLAIFQRECASVEDDPVIRSVFMNDAKLMRGLASLVRKGKQAQAKEALVNMDPDCRCLLRHATFNYVLEVE
jgi:hypothetical protein